MDKDYEEGVQDFLGQFPEPGMEPEDRAPPEKRLITKSGVPIPPGVLHFDITDSGDSGIRIEDARIYDMRADQGHEIVWDPRPFDDGFSVTLDGSAVNADLLNDIIWGRDISVTNTPVLATTTNAGPIGVTGTTANTGYTLSAITDAVASITQRLNQQYTTTNFNTP